jgi:hypothetical protein
MAIAKKANGMAIFLYRMIVSVANIVFIKKINKSIVKRIMFKKMPRKIRAFSRHEICEIKIVQAY